MNWIERHRARQVLRHRAAYHMRVRASILRMKQVQDMSDMHYHVRSHKISERLWHMASCEFRCADRLRKLLTKYK